MDALARPAGELAIARVELPRGGTAFAVSDGLALTAFHVIGDRASGTVRHSEPELVFSGGSVPARVDDRSDPIGDVALLHLAGPLPPGSVPVALTSTVHRDRWSSRGFPVGPGGPESLTVDGSVVDPEQHQPESGASVIALYCRQAAAGSPQRLNGFSGAPVLVADPPVAVGLIRWNPINPDQPGIAVGGTVYACPARSILSRWPELGLLDRGPRQPADTAEVAHLRRLIAQQEQNHRITETQSSRYSSGDRPLWLINQLNDIENELKVLRERLRVSQG